MKSFVCMAGGMLLSGLALAELPDPNESLSRITAENADGALRSGCAELKREALLEDQRTLLMPDEIRCSELEYGLYLLERAPTAAGPARVVSRAQVIGELLRARARGELDWAGFEIGLARR